MVDLIFWVTRHPLWRHKIKRKRPSHAAGAIFATEPGVYAQRSDSFLALRSGRHRLLPALFRHVQRLDRRLVWQELGYDYAELITGRRYGFPFVHIECDFKVPSRIGEVIDLTLLIEDI